MSDPTVVVVSPPPHDADFSSSLVIPPLDDAFFSQHFMESNVSGDNQYDDAFHEDVDFDFSFDDLCLPSSDLDELLSDPIYNTNHLENGNLFDEANAGSGLNFDQYHGVFKSDCPNLRHLPAGSNKSSNGSGVLDSNSPGLESNQISGYLNVPSPESDGSNPGNSGCSGAEAKGTYCPSPESQGSGNCCSNVSKNSENCARSVNSMPDANFGLISSDTVDQKIKSRGSPNNNVNSSMLKRKKESNDLAVCHVDNNLGSRINKFRKSEYNVETNHNNCSISGSNEDDGKKKARLMRNRESAQLSRQRKKQYVDELEDKVRTMHSTIQDLNAKISFFMTENMTLRQQMGAGGSNGAVPPPQMATPHPGMFPHPATMYPWMPSAPPYMMRLNGSQVPLVPIPRLKSQQQANVAKVSKKVEAKKSGGAKSKKVAAVSFIGLLFFIILFGDLVPIISMKYGGVREAFSSDNSYVGGGYYENYHGRLLVKNGTEHVEKYGGERESSCNSGGGGHCSQRGDGSRGEPGTDEIVHLGNGSKPLVASLYVPRNDKLVKIDGNLIIHSVLASEKAMISRGQGGGVNGLAVRGDLAPAVPVPGMGRNDARLPHLRELGSGSADKDSLKSKANDGRLQQWFREGLSGPMLSSGMCTEVFQFDVSSASTSGAIVPATASRNISEQQNKNSSHLSKGRNRRILHGHPIPFPGSSHNISEEQAGRHSQNKNLNINKSASSVVVSVLVDPREASDTDVDGVMGAKALSRIFVVILIDSVKYVTYSCMLPFRGAAPHLVTT
ncbi:bZIP transcription factor 17-like [Primulina huaijiensis]|uniref:bZIP transcription factor 17-like n=1 Tax=Primulina huaijiensis TaxID=1492673 RepID=UPI003CC7227A